MIRTYDEIIHPKMELRWMADCDHSDIPISATEIARLYDGLPATTAGVLASGIESIREQLDVMSRNYGRGIWRYDADIFDALISRWNWRAAIDEDQDCDEPVDYFHQESASHPSEDEASTEDYVCLDLQLLFGEADEADDHE